MLKYMKGLGNVSFRYFKRAFIKYLKHTHLMAVKTIYCVKRRQAIIIVFFLGGGVPFLPRSKKLDLWGEPPRIKLC